MITITADQYNKVTKGNDYFPEGMLIQNVQTGEVDIYSGGQRHWISVPVETRMNLTASQVTTISASQFNQIPQGNDYFPDGVYLQNQETGEISQYSGGKNHVVSAPVAVGDGPDRRPSGSRSRRASTTRSPKGTITTPTGCSSRTTRPVRSTSSPAVNDTGSRRGQLQIAWRAPAIAVIGADQYNAIPRRAITCRRRRPATPAARRGLSGRGESSNLIATDETDDHR